MNVETSFTTIKRQLVTDEPIIEEGTTNEDDTTVGDDDEKLENKIFSEDNSSLNNSFDDNDTLDTQEDRQRTFSELKAFSESFRKDTDKNDVAPTENDKDDEERQQAINDLKAFADSLRKLNGSSSSTTHDNEPPQPQPQTPQRHAEEEVVFQKDDDHDNDNDDNDRDVSKEKDNNTKEQNDKNSEGDQDDTINDSHDDESNIFDDKDDSSSSSSSSSSNSGKNNNNNNTDDEDEKSDKVDALPLPQPTLPESPMRSIDTEDEEHGYYDAKERFSPKKKEQERERRTFRSLPEPVIKSLVVRLFLDGDDRFCRRINLNRIFDGDDEMLNQILDDSTDGDETDSSSGGKSQVYSVQKIKNLGAATFKIHAAEISLSVRGIVSGEMSLIVDDADLVEAFRDAKSDTSGDTSSLTLDVFVTQTLQQAVFINVQLPDSDSFRLIDMERILNADRQPSLQRLRSIISPTLQSTRPSRSIRFAYSRSQYSRFLLHNDFDFDDAVASCNENEVAIQAFYADDGNEGSSQQKQNDGKSESPAEQQKTEELVERLEKFEQLVGQQTQMFITTQTQIRSLEEARERKHVELRELVAEVDERTSGDAELLDRLEKALTATLQKIKEMKLESLGERVEKLEEHVGETLPRLEIAAVGAITATKDLDARLKRQSSNKIEFVGKERLQAVEEKVANLSEEMTKMTEESTEMSMEEEQAAHELGERLKFIETGLRELSSKNGSSKRSAAGMSDKERQQILNRLDTLEDSVAIIRNALDQPESSAGTPNGKTAPPDDSSNHNDGKVVTATAAAAGEMV